MNIYAFMHTMEENLYIEKLNKENLKFKNISHDIGILNSIFLNIYTKK